MDQIKILYGALEPSVEGHSVLRGVLDPAALWGIAIPAYQRETVREGTIDDLSAAYKGKTGRPPDVELAVRGTRYDLREDSGTFTITGDVFVVDGLQRLSGARVAANRDEAPRVGATIYFGTTEAWERERFDVLNMCRTRLSPNLLLRNRASQCPWLGSLYALCLDPSFALYEMVSWAQYMRRDQVMTALTFVKTVMRLHARFGSGRSAKVEELWRALPLVMADVGQEAMIANIRAFFDLLDNEWGVREVLYKNRAIHLKTGFLSALADVFAEYPAFWSGTTLRIDRDVAKKIGKFPLNEPSVRAMACSGSNLIFLTRNIVDHINSGKRTRRLVLSDPHLGVAPAAESMSHPV